MKFYTTDKELPYNDQSYTVLSNTGLPVEAVVFEDSYGFIVQGKEIEPYSDERFEFFIQTNETEEETGHFAWENVKCEGKQEYKGGHLYSLENGDFVFRTESGKYGYFVSMDSVLEYIASV